MNLQKWVIKLDEQNLKMFKNELSQNIKYFMIKIFIDLSHLHRANDDLEKVWIVLKSINYFYSLEIKTKEI